MELLLRIMTPFEFWMIAIEVTRPYGQERSLLIYCHPLLFIVISIYYSYIIIVLLSTYILFTLSFIIHLSIVLFIFVYYSQMLILYKLLDSSTN